jgi:hypothetical protein
MASQMRQQARAGQHRPRTRAQQSSDGRTAADAVHACLNYAGMHEVSRNRGVSVDFYSSDALRQRVRSGLHQSGEAALVERPTTARVVVPTHPPGTR